MIYIIPIVETRVNETTPIKEMFGDISLDCKNPITSSDALGVDVAIGVGCGVG